jgi:hypothetical protein
MNMYRHASFTVGPDLLEVIGVRQAVSSYSIIWKSRSPARYVSVRRGESFYFKKLFIPCSFTQVYDRQLNRDLALQAGRAFMDVSYRRADVPCRLGLVDGTRSKRPHAGNLT